MDDYYLSTFFSWVLMLHTTVKPLVNAFTCSYGWIQTLVNNVVCKLMVYVRVDTYVGGKVVQIAFTVKLHSPLPTSYPQITLEPSLADSLQQCASQRAALGGRGAFACVCVCVCVCVRVSV